MNRQFWASRPNQLWVANIYVATWSGMVYVAFVFDDFYRRIAGWREATQMTTDVVLDTLEHAVWIRQQASVTDLAGLVHHTDAGQYVSFAITERHIAAGVDPSVGSVGDAGNNAMESFFSLLQQNVLDRRRWASREDLRIAIITWIERKYHRRRRQDAFGRVWTIDPHRVRSNHDHTRPPRRPNPTCHLMCSRPE